MVGGKTVSENYAFTGMHHIFDQHTVAGNTCFISIWNAHDLLQTLLDLMEFKLVFKCLKLQATTGNIQLFAI